MTRVGHLLGSLVMGWLITSILLHGPLTLLLGRSAGAQGALIVVDLIVIAVLTRHFYRNYDKWFEPL